MPRRGLTVCNITGCPNLTSSGRCTDHQQQADRARGTAADRGYTSPQHHAFREAVLARDPYCVVRAPGCTTWSTVADHHPTSRRDLIAAGKNPNDPKHGRGVCARCHNRETARNQPGGWNAGPDAR